MSGTTTNQDRHDSPTIIDRVRNLAPFLVSAGLLFWVFRRIDVDQALANITMDIVLAFLGPLALFCVVTLVIESHCLHRVAAANPDDARPLSHRDGARIKAACYLIGILNHVLGAAALSLLLRRRTGAGLAAAAGMVFLLALLDVTCVLACVGIGGTFLGAESVEIRSGVVGAMILAILAGFAFLRAPVSLGPLDRLRELDLFRAPRTTSLGPLIELGALRVLLVGCFVALVAALFRAFDTPTPLERVLFGVGVMLVVAALPLAVAGIGTGQVAFVAVFQDVAEEHELLAMSLLLSISLITSRACLGLLFAREFTKEALAESRAEIGPDGADGG